MVLREELERLHPDLIKDLEEEKRMELRKFTPGFQCQMEIHQKADQARHLLWKTLSTVFQERTKEIISALNVCSLEEAMHLSEELVNLTDELDKLILCFNLKE